MIRPLISTNIHRQQRINYHDAKANYAEQMKEFIEKCATYLKGEELNEKHKATNKFLIEQVI